ncbi:venom allergen 5-like isoform X2 [Scaptodrosophila lebanonensis]|uniref:Venom allergen 5-like isoform X2 n=1 Tax=Drosophila lebanonensis TaxID=7225 RepID=A0A6J2UH00_DROLE|nr:venom allergen 5-like isoform X2 [Scaptodrosophila lebanonensis]
MIDYWITLLLGLSVNLGCTSGYNYCSNKSHTCDKAGLKHFICRKETEFKPLFNTARYVTTLPETMRLRRTILDYFNRFRDELASGELLTNSNKSFKSAARMRALIWDEELAYTARMHASTVSFKHSECRSVSRFPMTGESLGLVGVSSEPRKIEDILNLTLRVMFDEFLAVEDPDRIVDFFDPLSDYSVAHFSCIGNDRLSRVGCGIATATRCSKNKNEEGGNSSKSMRRMEIASQCLVSEFMRKYRPNLPIRSWRRE